MARQNGINRSVRHQSVELTPISRQDVDTVLDRAIQRERRYFRLTEGQRKTLVHRSTP